MPKPPANKSGKGPRWFIGQHERQLIATFLRTYPADWASQIFGRARRSCTLIAREHNIKLRGQGRPYEKTEAPLLAKHQIHEWKTRQANAQENDARDS